MPEQSTSTGASAPGAAELPARLTAGDEAGFSRLLDAWSPGMHRLAKAYVGDAMTAREVVQETWLTVIENVTELEGGRSLKESVYRILVEAAQRRADRDGVVVPVDVLSEEQDPTVARSRFRPYGAPFPGHWTEHPARWPADASQTAAPADEPADDLADELGRVVSDAVRRLPPHPAAVLTLRDIEGYDATQTCALLDLSATSQLVLLHGARAAVRMTIEQYFGDRDTDRRLRDRAGG